MSNSTVVLLILLLLTYACLQESSDVSTVVEADGNIGVALDSPSVVLADLECSSCVPSVFNAGENHLSEDLTHLKHRKYLIDSGEDYFPERMSQRVDPEFPKVYEVDLAKASAAFTTVAGTGAWLRELLDRTLHKYGAVVIRGLPLNRSNLELAGNKRTFHELTNKHMFSFSELLRHTGYELTKYVGGVTVRPEKEPMIYPASDENPEVCMDLHQDNTYWPKPPAKLFFFYENVAASGGLNPLVDMRTLLQLIPADVANKFERLGVRYENFYPDKNVDAKFVPWQDSFQTEDRAQVEENLQAGGFEFEWEKVDVQLDDVVNQAELETNPNVVYNLRKWNVLSPFKTHPVTGEKLWVNMIVANHASYFHAHPNYPSLLGVQFGKENNAETARESLEGDLDPNSGSNRRNYPFNIKYGDGSEVPYSVIQTLRRLAWENARGFQPRDGDVLVIDNYIVQHGRLGYTPPRNMWLGISLS